MSARIKLIGNIPFQEKLLFTKHLSTMIKAGIPISEALDSLVEQSRNNAFRKIIQNILQDVENGSSLTSALKKYPRVFDAFYTGMVSVGEESGRLENNLIFLSDQLSKDMQLKKKIASAMLYPSIVIVAMVIMGGFISYFILPKLVEFFQSFDIELPLSTRILLAIAYITQNYFFYILAGFILAVVLLRFSLKINKIRFFWHRLIIRFPLMGKIVSYGQLSRFGRNLGTLVKSGIPIDKAMDITASTMSNLLYAKHLTQVSSMLSKGKSIGETLKNNKYSEFPPIVYRMIDVGEKTGNLDESLLYIGNFYEDEVDDLTKNLSSIIEPVLLVVIGIAVGFVALSIISPIYQLTGSIRN